MADHRKCLHPAPTCSLFDFQIAPRGGLWEAALHLFYSALKSGAQQRLPLQGGSEKLSRVFISDCVGGGSFICVPRDVSFRGSTVQCDCGARSAVSWESASRSSFLVYSDTAANDVICHSGNTLSNQPIAKRRVSLFLFLVPLK